MYLICFLEDGTDEMLPPVIGSEDDTGQVLRVVVAEEAARECQVMGRGVVLLDDEDMAFGERVVQDCV